MDCLIKVEHAKNSTPFKATTCVMRQLKITKSITNRESQSLDKYLQEISKEEPKQDKKVSNFLTEKDSNYSQFDMSKVPEKKETPKNDKAAELQRQIAELEA